MQTVISLVLAILLCELLSVSTLQNNMTTQARNFVEAQAGTPAVVVEQIPGFDIAGAYLLRHREWIYAREFKFCHMRIRLIIHERFCVYLKELGLYFAEYTPTCERIYQFLTI